MNRYDPEQCPDPEAWLALDEHERILLVEKHHRDARVKLTNLRAHAVFHVVVENQIAEGLDSVVRAMARLAAEGLGRHEATHAVGSALAGYLYEVMHAGENTDTAAALARYNAALDELSAERWLRG